jgi:hypothetical protein
MAMKLGRWPRTYDARVPHYASMLASAPKLPTPPATLNNLKGMAPFLGYMLNDSQGCCTCSACGHAMQIWSFNAEGSMLNVPDSAVEALYETQGYVPGDPSTDNGANEQSVLTQWLNGGFDGNKLAGFVEVDPQNQLNVQRVIYECAVAYNGWSVPAYVEDLEAPGSVWDVPGSSGISANADTTIVGGHCTLFVGYEPDGQNIMYVVESWGSQYYMTPAFVAAFMDEAYGLIDQTWLQQSGYTVAGKNLAQLEQLMKRLRS